MNCVIHPRMIQGLSASLFICIVSKDLKNLMNKSKIYLIYNLTRLFLHYPHVVYEKQKQEEN